MTRKIIGCMLTHEPHVAINSLLLLSELDLLVVFLPEQQKADLLRRLAEERADGKALPKIEVVTHRVELRHDGVPQMGVLRYEQQSLLQSRMAVNDIGLLLDHDIKIGAAVLIEPKKLRKYNASEGVRNAFFKKCGVQNLPHNFGGRYKALSAAQKRHFAAEELGPIYSQSLTAKDFVGRALLLGRAARSKGYAFFSYGYANAPHNSRAMKGGYFAAATWSGLVFLFKDSPNYYDPDMTIGSDTDVQFHIIHDRKALGVLCDPCTVVQMELKKEKYMDGGPQHKARIKDLTEVVRRYAPAGRPVQGNDLRCGLEHVKYTGIYGKE